VRALKGCDPPTITPLTFHVALERAIELAAARQARPTPRQAFALVFPLEAEGGAPPTTASAVPGRVHACFVGLGLHVAVASVYALVADVPIAIALGVPLQSLAMEVARRGSVSNIVAENANVAQLVSGLLAPPAGARNGRGSIAGSTGGG